MHLPKDVQSFVDNFKKNLEGTKGIQETKEKGDNKNPRMIGDDFSASIWNGMNIHSEKDVETLTNEFLESWEKLNASTDGAFNGMNPLDMANVKSFEDFSALNDKVLDKTKENEENKRLSEEDINAQINANVKNLEKSMNDLSNKFQGDIQNNQQMFEENMKAWESSMEELKSTISEFMETNKEAITSLIEERTKKMEEIKAKWDEGIEKIKEKISDNPKDTDGIKELYDELVEDVTADLTEGHKDFDEKFTSQREIYEKQKDEIANRWQETLEEFQSKKND